MLTRHDRPDAVTVAAAGVVDAGSAPQLARAIAAALVDTAVTAPVMVDLSGLELLDSAGISALLQGRRLADAAGRSFRVVGAAGIVREVLELTGVWQHLTGEPA
jgi:anti-anti-sigma factor